MRPVAGSQSAPALAGGVRFPLAPGAAPEPAEPAAPGVPAVTFCPGLAVVFAPLPVEPLVAPTGPLTAAPRISRPVDGGGSGVVDVGDAVARVDRGGTVAVGEQLIVVGSRLARQHDDERSTARMTAMKGR